MRVMVVVIETVVVVIVIIGAVTVEVVGRPLQEASFSDPFSRSMENRAGSNPLSCLFLGLKTLSIRTVGALGRLGCWLGAGHSVAV